MPESYRIVSGGHCPSSLRGSGQRWCKSCFCGQNKHFFHWKVKVLLVCSAAGIQVQVGIAIISNQERNPCTSFHFMAFSCKCVGSFICVITANCSYPVCLESSLPIKQNYHPNMKMYIMFTEELERQGGPLLLQQTSSQYRVQGLKSPEVHLLNEHWIFYSLYCRLPMNTNDCIKCISNGDSLLYSSDGYQSIDLGI